MNRLVRLFFSLCIVLAKGIMIRGSCYFQQEFQGEFVMQNNVGNSIQYATLNITSTAIPIWGNCHTRKGNNFILKLDYGENNCIRCLHLKLRSTNILQVIAASETISTCYTNEETAEENCPSDDEPVSNASEILLIRTKDALDLNTNKELCPINGRYSINYKGKGFGQTNECKNFASTMDTCPLGSNLNFKLRQCESFENYELNFECLGHWSKTNSNEHFMIFIDSRHSSSLQPKYRCATYKEDNKGNIFMAISNDSTCISNIDTSIAGVEIVSMIPQRSPSWPPEVTLGMYHFPDWMQGDWEHVHVEADTLEYKDTTNFKTFTMKCAGIQEAEDKYLVFIRTQCGEEYYSCMKIAKRSNNILEFQMGTNSSDKNDFFGLCSDSNFIIDSWITQGRIDVSLQHSSGMCPISGEYTGVIPDATELCAKLWSDCRAPDLMYYQVSQCDTSEVYEEREYKCLGHWKETELLYTYTQRRDVIAGSYECFVGSIIRDEEIYILEAGQHCQRHADPIRYGMKLEKKGLYSCISKMSTTEHNPVTQRTPASKPWAPTVPSIYTSTHVAFTKTSRKPWNFDNSDDNSTTTGRPNGSTKLVSKILLHIMTLIILYLY